MLAVALLPAAAYLTGTLRLLWEIGDAFVTWATRLTFSPTVWIGVMLAGISVALFLTAGMLRRRGVGTPARPREKALPAGDWRIAQAQSLLGAALAAERRYADAKLLMVAADQSLNPVPGRQAREQVANRRRLDALTARK